MISADRAQATAVSRTCAELDPAQGGAPIAGEVNLTVVVGDRIRVTSPNGQVQYAPPGSGSSVASTPLVIEVGAGQAGVHRFAQWFSVPTVACTVDGAFPTGDDKSKIADHLLGAFNQVDTSIFGPDGVPGSVIDGGGGSGPGLVPVGFAGTNANEDGPLDGLSGFTTGPSSLTALPGQSSDNGFAFEADLQSLIARGGNPTALGYGGPGNVPAMRPSPWSAWVAGRYVDFDDDQADGDRDGHLWWITSGLSYRLSDRTTVGGFTRVRQGEVDSAALGASLDSEFFGGGAFLSTTTPGGVRLTAGALYEAGDHDIAIGDVRVGSGTSTGSFDTDQWTVEARLDKRFTSGPYWIEPAATVRYTELERDGYTDGAGGYVPASDLALGRVTFGPTVGMTIERADSTVKPFARVNGLWNFENEGDLVLSTGAVLSSADSAVNLGGGLEIAYDSGVTVVVAGDWYGFDSDLEAWSMTGGLGIPLSALGFGDVAPGGVMSLGFTGREDEASANAKMTLPLN